MITDSMIDEFVSRYNHYRKEGYKETPAKELAKQDTTWWTSELFLGNPTLSNRIQQGYKRNPYVAEPVQNLLIDTVQEREPVEPRKDIVRYIEAFDFDIGSEISFNFHFEQWKYGKKNDSAWRQVFMYPDKNLLGKNGWKFEVLNKSGKEFRVKVLAKPTLPEPVNHELQLLERLEAEMEAEHDKRRRELAELKARLSNGNGKH